MAEGGRGVGQEELNGGIGNQPGASAPAAVEPPWPCRACRRARRRCEGNCPCIRCFEVGKRCVEATDLVATSDSDGPPAPCPLDCIFAGADVHAHALLFIQAVEGLVGQGRCSRSRAATVLSGWQRLSIAASGQDVTHGIADHIRTLLQIDVPPPLPPPGGSAPGEELQRLLAGGDVLAAKGSLRWTPPLESAAVLCEELSSDRLCLAGNAVLGAFLRDGPGLLSAAVQHAALPMLLLASLIEHDCREHWFESLAYVTFVDHAKPRTHIFKMADKDSCVRVFIVRLQRFDVTDGQGGFAITHRFERLPESRYVIDRPNQGKAVPDLRFVQPLDAFAERQQTLRQQRRRRRGPEAGAGAGAGAGADDGDGGVGSGPPSSRPRGGGSGVLTRVEVVQMLRKPSPASLRRLLRTSPRPQQQQGAKTGRLPPPPDVNAQSGGPFRGLATLPVLLGIPPACVDMEAKIASLTPTQVEAILEPRNPSILRLLCPDERQDRDRHEARPLCVQPSPAQSEAAAAAAGAGRLTPLSPTVEAALSSLVFGDGDGVWGVGAGDGGEEDLSMVGKRLWDSPCAPTQHDDGAK